MSNKTKNISSMYEEWFLEYASYVILERAVPKIDDGLKPVQRRIFHSLKRMHDKRFHKVANIIGHTMQFHPHGDKAIGDALVALGQKDLMIETQGNWGDIRTGDKAAAPRYIEARLTDFALEIAFNKNITEFQNSYDGRNIEPVSLPIKFPLVLAQGAEGIAVGLSTKIMPHNFNELLKASINILNDKHFSLYPDFHTGGIMDVDSYNNGKRGGKIRIRSSIDIVDKETLIITDLCYGITTTSLIDSIVKANNNGKIKIKSIEDNTSENVEVIIHLVKGVSPNVTIDALYAFTNCEVSISPNCCVIVNNKPKFTDVRELLKISTNKTVNLLKSELEYILNELYDKLHNLTLESLFIEHRIYRKIENCETLDLIETTIINEFKKLSNKINKKIDKDDVSMLIDLKIKRITKYDKKKQSEKIVSIKHDIEEVKNNLKNLNDYAIRFFKHLIKKYGDKYLRKTKIQQFDSISARRVVVANQKLFINKKEGFIGTSLRTDEFVSKCSDIDNIIVFLENGNYVITKVEQKKYVGKNIIYACVWKKNDKHMIYNLIYKDLETSVNYVKRFAVTSIIKDKLYQISKFKKSKILYFTANPNSESEIVSIHLHHKAKALNKSFTYDFKDISIKNRTSKGNILSKYNIRKVEQKYLGESTLGGRDIWIDENIGRLNNDNRGEYLGSFNSDDRIIVFYKNGTYEMTNFDESNRYKMNDITLIEKCDIEKIYTLIHQDGKNKKYYIKKFKITTSSLNKKNSIINKSRGSKLIKLSSDNNLLLTYNYRLINGSKKQKNINIDSFIDIKGYKAIGKIIDNKKRMSGFNLSSQEKVDADNSETKVINENNIQEDGNLTLF